MDLVHVPGSRFGAINELYPAVKDFIEIRADLEILGKKINNYIKYADSSWRT